jgi:hypothetical protein
MNLFFHTWRGNKSCKDNESSDNGLHGRKILLFCQQEGRRWWVMGDGEQSWNQQTSSRRTTHRRRTVPYVRTRKSDLRVRSINSRRYWRWRLTTDSLFPALSYLGAMADALLLKDLCTVDVRTLPDRSVPKKCNDPRVASHVTKNPIHYFFNAQHVLFLRASES